MSVFEVRSSDEEIKPANDRFSKADGYHVVPPPISGNFLTPRADISFAGLDEYAIRKKIIESKITEPRDNTSESKTSETVGKTNEVEKSKTKINRDKVIIEDCNLDDEDDVSDVNTVSPVKTNETQTSTDHLIKDCNFYAKKSPETKLKTVVNTGQRVVKPVWDNGVLTRTGLVNPVRSNGKRAVHTVSTARPISTARPVSTDRPFALKIPQTGNAIRPIYPIMVNVRPSASYSPIKRSYYTRPAVRPKDLKQDVKIYGVKNITSARTIAVVNTGKGKMDNALKKSRWVWRPKGNYMDHESKEKGSFILKKFEYVDPKGISKSVDHAVVDSGCSSHMTGNKAYLSDYEDYNGGFVAFGISAASLVNIARPTLSTARLEGNSDFHEIVDFLAPFEIYLGSHYADIGREYLWKLRNLWIEGGKRETEEVKLTDDTKVVEDKGSGDKGGNAEELYIFDDEDITMAQTLIKIKEEKAKEKGVSIKDVDDSSRPARSILTLKPLPTIDPKDKGKGVLKESPVKKVKRSDLDAAQIAKDAEIARLVHEKEPAEMEREREERQRQDQASVDYIASLYDEVQAKMDASEELAARLQMEERERCKYRHNQLNKKTFEEIQALYIKEQERDADFMPIGSERDEKMIDKMNKKAAGMDEEEVPEEPESTKVEVK
ncbi:hypothetical protein Tco_0849306 [Tanacetum coccineum]